MSARGRLPAPAAVLFDQDGTVADTEPIWMASETDLMERHGARWSTELGTQMVGQPLLRSAGILIEHADLPMTPEEVVDDMLSFVGAAIRRDGVPWLPGIPELLGRLHARGVPTALVTSTYAVVSREVVAASSSLPGGGFDLLVAGDDVVRAKPAPDAYLLAAQRLGVDIAQCLVLEDSASGIASALAAGAHVVAIPCVLPVEPREGLSILPSADALDDAMIARILSGEVVDGRGATSA